MGLTEKNICIIICTPCTLNCRLCVNCTPLYESKGIHYFVSMETYQREVEGLFQVYEHIGTLSIAGGEPLLHNQITEIAALTLSNFSAKFDRLRIITNGTVLPTAALLEEIHRCARDNFDFQISDYGKYSAKIKDVVQILEENHIAYRVKKYYGEDQWCGGWIDYGPLDVFRGYSDDEAKSILAHCRSSRPESRCLCVFEGKLCICNHAACAIFLNLFESERDDYVDLLGNVQTLPKKRRIAAAFGSKAIRACYYCNGFDPENSPRFPAAEQI